MSPFIEVLVLALVHELPAMSQNLGPEDFKRAALTRFQDIVSVAPAYDLGEINVIFEECRAFYGWYSFTTGELPPTLSPNIKRGETTPGPRWAGPR